MPAKYSRKQYLQNGYYHLYNRGVEKRKIFKDDQDYKVFLSYLKDYLEPKKTLQLQKQLANSEICWKEKDKILRLLRLNNFHGEVNLMVYCLMPNHFHLLIKQKNEKTINSFMNSIFTRYTMYFNKKNKRVGHLFQGRYKAVLVETDEQLLHLSRYIHRNPARPGLEACYSSFGDYIGIRKTAWIDTKQILSHFSKTNPSLNYKAFVEKTGVDSSEALKNIMIA